MQPVSSPERSRLPDEVQQVADDLNHALAADGWRVEARPAEQTNRFDVALSHPLVPGEHTFQYERATIVDKHGLLRGLRAAAAWPHGDGAPGAMRSVGYLLFEEVVARRVVGQFALAHVPAQQ